MASLSSSSSCPFSLSTLFDLVEACRVTVRCDQLNAILTYQVCCLIWILNDVIELDIVNIFRHLQIQEI